MSSVGGKPGPSRVGTSGSPPSSPQFSRAKYPVAIICSGGNEARVAVALHIELRKLNVEPFPYWENRNFLDKGTEDLFKKMRSVSIAVFILHSEHLATEGSIPLLVEFATHLASDRRFSLLPVFINSGSQNQFTPILKLPKSIYGMKDSFGFSDEAFEIAINTLQESFKNSGFIVPMPHEAKFNTRICEIALAIQENCARLALADTRKPTKSDIEAAIMEGEERLETVRLMILGGPKRGKTATVKSLLKKDGKISASNDLNIFHVTPDMQKMSVQDFSEFQKQVLEKDKFRAIFNKFWKRREVLRMSHSFSEVPISPVVQGKDIAEEPCRNFERHRSEKFENRETKERNISKSALEFTERLVGQPEKTLNHFRGPTVRIWDFGGEAEYQIPHELFISPRCIVVFVFNLKAFEDMERRDEEVNVLCHWIEVEFALTGKETRPLESRLIVATRRDECKHYEFLEKYFEILRHLLHEKLDKRILESWTNMKIISVENGTTSRHSIDSGELELGKHIFEVARKIVRDNPKVPLRWLALLEKLREREDKQNSFCISRTEILSEMEGFAFPAFQMDRTKDLQNFLCFFRNLGDILFFYPGRAGNEVDCRDDAEFVVFTRAEKVIRAIKAIVSPYHFSHSKTQDRMKTVGSGLISISMLEERWGQMDLPSPPKHREAFIDLLTSLDFLVDLGNGSYGIPTLMESGWENWKWVKRDTVRKEISALTKFESYPPFGLFGTIGARIHKGLGEGRNDIRLVRSNAILITMGLDQRGTNTYQVFLGFDRPNRELQWKVCGDEYEFGAFRACLLEFEKLRNERYSRTIFNVSHSLVVTRCPNCCYEGSPRLEFMIPHNGLPDVTGSDSKPSSSFKTYVDAVSKISDSLEEQICQKCSKPSSYKSAFAKMQHVSIPTTIKDEQHNYEVFISHAGASDDKDWAVKMADDLNMKRIRSFVDRKELTGGDMPAEEIMEKALRSARVGVFILSPEFFSRSWPIRELKTFLERAENGEQVILYPIFHRLPYEHANDLSVNMEDYWQVFVREKLDLMDHADSVQDSVQALKKLCRYSGLVKKQVDMHKESKTRNRIRYEILRLVRAFWHFMGGKGDERELGGVTLEEFFNYATKMIVNAYEKLD